MKLRIPAGAFQAYLFDCDGTIADSMPLHYVVWRSALAEWNCTFPKELFYAWGGFPVAEIISRLNEKQGLQMPIPAVERRKEEFYFDALPQLKAATEVLEHIDAQYDRIPFAVVSGTSRSQRPRQSVIQSAKRAYEFNEPAVEQFSRPNRVRADDRLLAYGIRIQKQDAIAGASQAT